MKKTLCALILPSALLALFATNLPSSAFALDPMKAITQYRHRAWTTDSGLPSIEVKALVQTPDGYLWIGTEEGLVRFDGVRFTIFTKNTTPELRHNFVDALRLTSDGTLLIGTEEGVAAYKNGVFKIVPGAGRTSRGLFEAGNSATWALSVQGLWRLSPEGGSPFPLPPLPSPVRTIMTDPDSVTWIGTDSGLVSIRDNQITNIAAAPGFEGSGVTSLLRTKDGALWVGTTKGIEILKEGRMSTVLVGAAGLDDPVKVMRQDKQGTVWAGTTHSGLVRIAGGKTERFQASDGLLHNEVLSILEDRDGNLVIGTVGGLELFADVSFTSYGVPEGFGPGYGRPIIETSDGSIWSGYQMGGLCRWKDGVVTHFNKSDGVPEATITSLAQTRDGVLWVGTDGGGLLRYQNGRFNSFTAANGLASNRVEAIREMHDGTVWVAFRDAGLAMFRDGRSQAVVDARIKPNIATLTEGPDGSVWLGGLGGLQRLRDNKVENILTDRTVRSLYAEANGDLWIGTMSGLLRYRQGKIYTYTSASGLFNDVVFAIIDDFRGRLWLTCNVGVFSVSKAELDSFDSGERRSFSCHSYGPFEGTRSQEFNGANPGGTRDHTGRLWFPTTAGITSVDPDHMLRGTLAPPVVIERVAVDGAEISPRESAHIKPGRGQLQFRYTAPNISAAERLTFKYQLVGFDDNWIEAGNARTATYTN
ncbi:MAG TPA: two-component regulator propeller domain-containing protein, partial [Pyrinomonadaceae bacterium]